MADLQIGVAVRPRHPSRARGLPLAVLASIRDLWRSFVRRRAERRMLVRLSRLGPHLMADMGFEPNEVYDALDGSWDEADPGRFRRR